MLRPPTVRWIKPATVKDHTKRSDWIKTAKICCVENMQDYLKSTSLHGLKYIGNDDLTLFER